jgi:hypothetical protein
LQILYSLVPLSDNSECLAEVLPENLQSGDLLKGLYHEIEMVYKRYAEVENRPRRTSDLLDALWIFILNPSFLEVQYSNGKRLSLLFANGATLMKVYLEVVQ